MEIVWFLVTQNEGDKKPQPGGTPRMDGGKIPLKWMITRGNPILGNPHLGRNRTCWQLDFFSGLIRELTNFSDVCWGFMWSFSANNDVDEV